MSSFKTSIIVLAMCGSAMAVPATAALTVETSPFITSPTATNGFEGIGDITAADGVTSYSEDGISVNYVGSGFIWSTSQPTPDGEYSWYPDGGGTGYTSITFDDATEFELIVSSGWFDGSGAALAYEVLLDGALIGTGIAGPVPGYEAGWATYGFSGATFDEVHLQVTLSPTGFDAAAYEAGAFDAIKIASSDGPAVPEPATWALMITGFAAAGAMLRRARPHARVRFA